MPDGTCVDSSTLDFSQADAGAGARVGQSSTSDPAAPGPADDPIGPVVNPNLGTGTSGNPTADALNLQWQALASVLPLCPQLGNNPQLPQSLAPDLVSTFWLTDYADWQTFYSQFGTWSLSQITGDLVGWQSYANSWAAFFKQQCPNIAYAPPANFPVGPSGGTGSLPSVTSLLPSASTVSTFGWVLFAALVGVGVWMIWPAIAGAHGAAAALF